MTATAIEWADRVWNPVTGCTKVSQGCKHCYAEVVANRFFGRQYPEVEVPSDPSLRCGAPSQQWSTRPRVFTDVQTHADRLDAPLRWRKPARVFVNSMSDLFHESVPDEFIERVLSVVHRRPQHTFMVLTKRPERMRAFMTRPISQWTYSAMPAALSWPFSNLWLGVSVEDKATADQRIPLLLQTPAAVRWVSFEPLLGPVNLDAIHTQSQDGLEHAWWSAVSGKRFNPWADGDVEAPRLDWVVVGGESGPKARPCNVDWIVSILEQCRAAGVPAFVKQLGANCGYAPALGEWFQGHTSKSAEEAGYLGVRRLIDRKGGDPAEWPESLRVRQFPAVSR